MGYVPIRRWPAQHQRTGMERCYGFFVSKMYISGQQTIEGINLGLEPRNSYLLDSLLSSRLNNLGWSEEPQCDITSGMMVVIGATVPWWLFLRKHRMAVSDTFWCSSMPLMTPQWPVLPILPFCWDWLTPPSTSLEMEVKRNDLRPFFPQNFPQNQIHGDNKMIYSTH